MDEPSKIKAHLLAIVVLNDIKRLHVVEEASCQHANYKSETIVHPTAINLTTFRHVHREMLQDNFFLHEFVKFKLPMKCLSNDLLLLT